MSIPDFARAIAAPIPAAPPPTMATFAKPLPLDTASKSVKDSAPHGQVVTRPWFGTQDRGHPPVRPRYDEGGARIGNCHYALRLVDFCRAALASWGDDTTVHHHGKAIGRVASEGCLKAFGIDEADAVRLQEAVNYLSPSPLISDARRVFDYGRQHEIPERAVDLYRRTRELSLSYWEQEAIRVSLNSPDGALRRLLEMKAEREGVNDPQTTYIRVDCFGKRIQSPCLLEIWPGGHHSPIHEHANSTGLMKGVFGRVDIMLYERLDARPKEVALLSMTPERCSWMSPDHYQAHKVYCPMDKHDFAATFHIYTDTQGDVFKYREEREPHGIAQFLTESDISWGQFYKALTDAVPYYYE